jgi:hypothetical protein
MTTLKRGDYCCPSTEAEWKSILDLAEALGIRLPVIYNGGWDTCPFIWYSDTVLNDEGVCQLSKRSGSRNDPKINVPDFIAGMYAMKEAKKNKPLSALNDGVRVVGTQSSYDDRLHSLEVKSLLLDDILKRLTKLEERPPIDMRECENVKKDNPYESAVYEQRDGWCYVIQMDESPKNIPFSIAIEYAKRGRRIRHSDWMFRPYAMITGGVLTWNDGIRIETHRMADWIPSNHWEVLPEPKKP